MIGDVDTGVGAGPLDWVVGFEYMSTDYSVLVDAQREAGNVINLQEVLQADIVMLELGLLNLDFQLLMILNFFRADDYSDFGSANNSKFLG